MLKPSSLTFVKAAYIFRGAVENLIIKNNLNYRKIK